MKKQLNIIVLFLFLGIVNAQTTTETIRKELQVSNPASSEFYIENIYGGITIEGYNGNTIQIEVTKKVSARNNELLSKGKKEISVKTAQKDNKYYAYLDSPYTHFILETGYYDYNNRRMGNRIRYDYTLDFKVKVPKNMSIDIRTVNDGDIEVNNVQAEFLEVKNINGAITLNNVAGQTDVNAINKDINITYAKNPVKESWYKSINGNINILFKNNLNADISYKTMNGDFYTNFDVKKTNPAVEKSVSRKGKSTKFKINSQKLFRIGNEGGVKLHFDQLNGETTVKK